MKTTSKFVVWRPVNALPFRYAVESASPAALAAARHLFAPWLLTPADQAIGKSSAAQTWHLENAGDAWKVSGYGLDAALPDCTLATALARVEYASIVHLVANLPSTFIGFHGALLSCEMGGKTRGILIVGPKEAGKSTLSCALWRAGWQLHCDDFSLLDDSARAYPTARRVSLRVGSRDLLGDLWERAQQTPNARVLSENLMFHPHELPDARPVSKTPIELSALIFLARRGSHVASAQTQSLSGIAAAFELLPYSTLLWDESGEQRADWGLELAQLARRVESLPIYDLGRGAPQAMISAIEALIQPFTL